MKKKIQKPFSVEEWKNGAKVETSDGSSVRILCTDLKSGHYPIVAAITCQNGEESILNFDANGRIYKKCESNDDLVIVEEVEDPKQWAEHKSVIGDGWTIDDDCCEANVTYRPEVELNEKYNYDVFATEKQAKSALAMARISQLMAHDERYGGVVTDKEWKCSKINKFVLYRHEDKITYGLTSHTYRFLSFHTEEQCDLFLEENEQLVKDYLMID